MNPVSQLTHVCWPKLISVVTMAITMPTHTEDIAVARELSGLEDRPRSAMMNRIPEARSEKGDRRWRT